MSAFILPTPEPATTIPTAWLITMGIVLVVLLIALVWALASEGGE